MSGREHGEDRPPRPSYRFTKSEPPAALAHLRDENVWVTWDFSRKADNGRWTKPPRSATTGRMQKDWMNAPGFVSTFDQALATIRKHGLAGIGISLGHAGLAGVDLDDCITDSGSLMPVAVEVLRYRETYAEVSPSGEGVHLLANAVDKTIKRDDLKIELYHHGRFFTVTGDKIEGAPDTIAEAPRLIERIVGLDAETPRPTKNGARAALNGHVRPPGGNFFANVNSAALQDLEAWVPWLHRAAEKQGTGAWRVSSKALGRDLEEDLSYHPDGIRDHGAEQGLTAIGAVLRYGGAGDATAAAMLLCQRMGVKPAALGWDTSGVRRAGAGKIECEPKSDGYAGDARPWPVLCKAAMRGLVGEFARVATEGSEADPVAVMLTAMTGIGALMGRARHIRVGDTDHHARLMCALVGATSRARKGTSWGPVRRLLERTEFLIQKHSTVPHPLSRRMQITHGPLSSGEGLVAAIRDAVGDDDAGGTDDKRLLVAEGEFGAALRAMQRQGSTLSMILRTAWDGHELAPLIKHDRTIATDPHICIIAHITRYELRELMNASDVWGGLANRLLWACVRRRAAIPTPQPISDQDLDRVAAELANVSIHAHQHPAELRMSNAASDHWGAVYRELTQDRPGLLGAATARAEAQTLRLALTFALVDGADRIEIHHLEAGLAMWRYAEDSAAYLFGGAELDPVAETIISALTGGPKTQNEIRDLFGRHQPAARLTQVLIDLQERGRVTLTEEPTAGRPRRIWSLMS